MGILQRIFGLRLEEDADLTARAIEAERIIERERKEYRRAVQRMSAGTASLMSSWDEVNRMINSGGRGGKHPT